MPQLNRPRVAPAPAPAPSLVKEAAMGATPVEVSPGTDRDSCARRGPVGTASSRTAHTLTRTRRSRARAVRGDRSR
ncbi:hypothetical protein GCM10011576_24660 [Micromonospora parathelypteridis]|nr:hypothetical protein GCM10011576_24660 [Micromonospora parathelypteridis]